MMSATRSSESVMTHSTHWCFWFCFDRFRWRQFKNLFAKKKAKHFDTAFDYVARAFDAGSNTTTNMHSIRTLPSTHDMEKIRAHSKRRWRNSCDFVFIYLYLYFAADTLGLELELTVLWPNRKRTHHNISAFLCDCISFFPQKLQKKKYTKMHFVNQRASRCFSPCDQLQTTRIRLSLSVSPTPFVLVSLFSHKICFSLHSLLVPSFRAHATRCRTAFIAIRQIENAHAHNPRLMPTDAQLNEITHQ